MGARIGLVLMMASLTACKFFRKDKSDSQDGSAESSAAPSAPSAPSGGDVKPQTALAQASGLTYIPKSAWNTREPIEMIPALVVVERAAQALGLNAQDDAFQKFRELQFLLGEVDYGSGMVPDPTWDSTKMARYLSAVQPVCGHKSIVTQLESEAGSIAFLAASYGRSATPEEKTYVKEFLQTSFGSERKKQLFCMAVLSSAGFVVQ